MNQINSHYDVVVVGAGLVGASFALSLAEKTDLSIAVVERSKVLSHNQAPNQRVSALGHFAVKVLEDIGVWHTLPDQAYYPYQSMFVWDDNSLGELSFKASDYGQSELGYIVDNVACVIALQHALQAHQQIDVVYGFNADRLSFDGQQASLLSKLNGNINGKLLVAADGGQSWVRQQCGMAVQRFDYKQLGIVTTIKTQRSHQNTAWQCFLDTGPVAVLPLTNQQSSIVWSADKAYAKQLMQQDDKTFAASLTHVVGDKLGHVFDVSQRRAFPLHSAKAKQYCQPNVVLMGDAAHSIHPLAGQGANLGFKDVQCLLSCMMANQNKALGNMAVLRDYERQRKLDNETTDLLMTALYGAFRLSPPWLSTLRGVMMGGVSQLTQLKLRLAEQAMGLS